MKNKYYGMFSPEGNKLVDDIVLKITNLPMTTDDIKIYDILSEEMEKLEKNGHGEVYDTDCREKIICEIEYQTNRQLTIYF